MWSGARNPGSVWLVLNGKVLAGGSIAPTHHALLGWQGKWQVAMVKQQGHCSLVRQQLHISVPPSKQVSLRGSTN